MPRANRRRIDVRLEHKLFDKLAGSALVDQRSINAQITWLLAYALIDWQEQFDNRLDRVKERAAG